MYSKLTDLSQERPKGSFSIATTLRCREGHYSFLWIAPLTLDPYLIMLSVKQGSIKNHFLSLWYDPTWDWTVVSRIIDEYFNPYANILCTHTQIIFYIYIGIVTRKFTFYPRTGFYFRTGEDGAGWHLIPYRISPRSEFFSQAYKNWHITWGINLWPDWPPLARGSKFHTIHIPTKAARLPPLEQWKIWTSRFSRNNIN